METGKILLYYKTGKGTALDTSCFHQRPERSPAMEYLIRYGCLMRYWMLASRIRRTAAAAGHTAGCRHDGSNQLQSMCQCAAGLQPSVQTHPCGG